VLPDSTELIAVSFGSADRYARDLPPDFGLYLDERWRPPWPYEHLDWPDFSVPGDPVLVVATLESLLHRARTSQRVEIGSCGGHGRTGTALVCLAVRCGQAPDEAVSWVRATYCERAVETDEQEAFARNLTR
jgi:protein-tyrosine phosphatase